MSDIIDNLSKLNPLSGDLISYARFDDNRLYIYITHEYESMGKSRSRKIHILFNVSTYEYEYVFGTKPAKMILPFCSSLGEVNA